MKAEGDVPGHRHMRKKGVALEHHAHVPLVRGKSGDVPALNPDRAPCRLDEARDHAQGRCLAAAGRSEKGDEFAGSDTQIEIVDGGARAIGLGEANEFEVGHAHTCLIDRKRTYTGTPISTQASMSVVDMAEIVGVLEYST